MTASLISKCGTAIVRNLRLVLSIVVNQARHGAVGEISDRMPFFSSIAAAVVEIEVELNIAELAKIGQGRT
jgi:hypothetical protein